MHNIKYTHNWTRIKNYLQLSRYESYNSRHPVVKTHDPPLAVVVQNDVGVVSHQQLRDENTRVAWKQDNNSHNFVQRKYYYDQVVVIFLTLIFFELSE